MIKNVLAIFFLKWWKWIRWIMSKMIKQVIQMLNAPSKWIFLLLHGAINFRRLNIVHKSCGLLLWCFLIEERKSWCKWYFFCFCIIITFLKIKGYMLWTILFSYSRFGNVVLLRVTLTFSVLFFFLLAINWSSTQSISWPDTEYAKMYGSNRN